MNHILILLFVLIFVGCTDKDKAKELLEKEGYLKIEITGYDWLGCPQEDIFSTGFIAFKNNILYKGTVCSGFFSGAVIRIKQ